MSALPIPQIDQQALTLPERARAIAIRDQETYNTAAVMLTDVVAFRKKITEEFAPLKQKAFEAHRAITAKEKEYLKPIEEAEGILKRGIGAFEAEQRRIEEENRRKAEEEARRQQEAALEAAVEEAEAAGAAPEEVEAIIAQPMAVPQIRVQPTFQRAAGMSAAKTYKAEVTSIRLLAKAVAEGRAPETFLAANMPALNQYARATKGSVPVAGVQFKEETGVRVGRG